MGLGGALALAAMVFAAGDGQAGEGEARAQVDGSLLRRALVHELPRADVALNGELRWVGTVGAHVTLDARPYLFDRSPLMSPSSVTPRSLTFGYSLGDAQARVQVRAGYRYGLPLDEGPPAPESGLVLTSGGSLSVSAGTVAWLQLDLDGFREVAGTRFMRLDAVPGLRFRPSPQSPYEGGVGMLVALNPSSTDGLGVERFAGVVQMSGRF